MIWWTQDLSALTTARPAPAASFSEAPASAADNAGPTAANVTPIRPPATAASHLHPDSAEPCFCTERLAS